MKVKMPAADCWTSGDDHHGWIGLWPLARSGEADGLLQDRKGWHGRAGKKREEAGSKVVA